MRPKKTLRRLLIKKRRKENPYRNQPFDPSIFSGYRVDPQPQCDLCDERATFFLAVTKFCNEHYAEWLEAGAEDNG